MHTSDAKGEVRTREFGPVKVRFGSDRFTIISEGSEVTLLAGYLADRVASAIWEWSRDKKISSGYAIDEPDEARNIVEFWNRGTASNFEKKLIETYLAGDTNMRDRLAFAFPMLATAIDEWKRGRNG